MEPTLEYTHEIASQLVVVSSLLTGFTVAIISNFMTSESDKKINKVILVVATFSCCCFIVATFAMTNIIMITTKGNSVDVTRETFALPNMIGGPSFLIGVLALCILVSLSGWTKTRTTGIITTIMGIITLLMLTIAMSQT